MGYGDRKNRIRREIERLYGLHGVVPPASVVAQVIEGEDSAYVRRVYGQLAKSGELTTPYEEYGARGAFGMGELKLPEG